MHNATAPRVVIAAISGPTCSGKTTLAKHLGRIIPSSLLLFQDDFAPPAELVPVDPKHGWQDWDDAKGAILWDKQRATLRQIRATGTLPDEHASHDHLNEQVPVPISEEVQTTWRRRFEELLQRQEVKPTIVIAEGFLMLVDPESVREFDVRLFMREDYAVLKRRREERHGYHTQVLSDAEGSLWRDPPEYWDLCVWPAYLRAHAPLFVDGDVERGLLDPAAIEGGQLLEAKELGMEEMVVRACEAIYEAVESDRGRERWTSP
ncbi:hypothetical protein JCM3770_002288 [Rhodotorula araucariae]